jgi:hypothetical protein
VTISPATAPPSLILDSNVAGFVYNHQLSALTTEETSQSFRQPIKPIGKALPSNEDRVEVSLVLHSATASYPQRDPVGKDRPALIGRLCVDRLRGRTCRAFAALPTV